MKTLLEDRRLLLPVLLTALVIAVGAVLIVVLGGGTSDSPSAARSTPPTATASAVTINITNFKFLPASVTVKAGTKVAWINNDSSPHTATAKGPGGFDTGNLTKGDKQAVTLRKPGTYEYICEIHPFMKATVVVR